jgi:hypothetical protein
MPLISRLNRDELAEAAGVIDAWARRELAVNPLLAAVDKDPLERRWYVRMRGEDKEVITVWLTLRERTLHFETGFMPAPEEDHERLWEYLLRVNARLCGQSFAIGAEEAVYLVGQSPAGTLDDDELDRIVGSAWAYCEQHFRSAMSIGFATRFAR